MIAALLLSGVVTLSSPTCPIAGPPDSLVACPGWGIMSCRVRNTKGELVRSRSRKAMLLRRTGRRTAGTDYYEHVYSLACGGCDVPWNLLFVTRSLWMEKRGWELKVCGLRSAPHELEGE